MTLCQDCLEKRKVKGLEDYTCPLCALGLSSKSDNIVKDPFTGTVYVDMTKLTYFDKVASLVTDSIARSLTKKGDANERIQHRPQS